MIAKRRGKIVHIASLMSEMARPSVVPYTAAKGGVRQLTRGMAVELAPHNIQVNAIAPGYFATEMNRALLDNAEFTAWVNKRTPAGRWAHRGPALAIVSLAPETPIAFGCGRRGAGAGRCGIRPAFARIGPSALLRPALPELLAGTSAHRRPVETLIQPAGRFHISPWGQVGKQLSCWPTSGGLRHELW